MTDETESRDLLSYLDFHVAAGVDAVLDEAPHDRFAESVRPAPAAPEPAPEPLRRPDPARPP
ncbi:MAG: uracil-DNA glycosylase, partial [Methylobacterium sp.]|nr:uracil-DNA glycosylase [Methylobacterium sp.]